MTRRPRRNHIPAFKAKVALAAIRGEQTLVEFSQQFDVQPTRSSSGKTSVLRGRQASSAMRRRRNRQLQPLISKCFTPRSAN